MISDISILEKVASTKAFYFNVAGRECDEKDATHMLIVNYDKDGNSLFSVRSECGQKRVIKSIFDFDPTDHEIDSLVGGMSREIYERIVDEMSKALDIAKMLYWRNDERYKEYFYKLDDQMQTDFLRDVKHP